MSVTTFRRTWLASATAYTLAGLVSSVVLGSALGLPVSLAKSEHVHAAGVIAAAAVGALGLARDLNIINFRLPQLQRQTPEFWRYGIPIVPTAALWGADLGLVFTTWLTYSGPWFLAMLALAGGEVWFGAALFSAHWIGRAAWVWTAPYLYQSPSASMVVAEQVAGAQPLFTKIHCLGLGLGIVTTVIWVLVFA